MMRRNLPSSTAGNTDYATPDTTETCGTTHTAPGVWFKVIGTGNTITASLCDAGTDYDTKLLVWCYTCETPMCVDGNDDDGTCTYSTLQSTVTWCSELGTEYMILVGGYAANTGNFVLNVSDDGVPCATPPVCIPPTGACCVDEVCVATNYEEECDVLSGQWYVNEDCVDFTCPALPRTCDDTLTVYTNGNQAPNINEYAVAQCDPVYPFQAATADDFILPGADSVDIGGIVTWTWHWNGNLNGPGDYEGINVVVYENDDITIPGVNRPAGTPVDGDPNCTHAANIPGGIVYETTILPGDFLYVALGSDYYRVDIPVNVRLAPGVRYWLEVQPIMQFGLAGQSGLTNSDTQTGEYLQRYFPVASIPDWTSSGDLQDMAFCLLAPGAGGDCCDYIVGDVNGSNSYNGLDITYGVAYFKGGSGPLCPDCTVDDCNSFNYCGDVNGSNSYNGLDITYGVAYFKGGPAPISPSDCPPCVGVSSGFGAPETPSVIKTKTIYEQKPSTK